MGYKISWYIPGRVVLVQFTDTISLEEAEACSDEVAQAIQDGKPPLVHLIADTTKMDRFPTNLNLLNRSASKHLWQPNLGWTIVITANSTTRWISGIITQVARVRFRMFPTLQDGLSFLNDQDPTLREQIQPGDPGATA
jgi:hypothetical protein